MIKRGTQTISKIYRGAREIAKIYRGRNLVWENGEQPQPVTGDFLTFSSPSRFTLATANSAKNWDGTLEYSQDAQNWYVWNGTTTLLAAASGGTYYLYLRGDGNTVITGSSNYGFSIASNGDEVECSGDIRALLSYATPESATMGTRCFSGLFKNCTSLKSTPFLPSLTLSNFCYTRMFYGCTGITYPPTLPAKVLKTACYSEMFALCTNILQAADVLADEYANTCCANMFDGCISIHHLPRIKLDSATFTNNACFMNMFRGCTSLKEVLGINLQAIDREYLFTGMFDGCISIKLSEVQTGEYQNEYRIPMSGTIVSADEDVFLDMFSGTGGTFTGTPQINTTYYTSNAVIPAT